MRSYFSGSIINTLHGSGAGLGAMEEVQARLKELEDEVSQVKLEMKAKDRGLEEQKKAIVDYMEKEFTTHKLVINEIVEGAKAEFTSQRFNLQQLYEATTNELESMRQRLSDVETRAAPGTKGRFLAAKHMLPRTLDKTIRLETMER